MGKQNLITIQLFAISGILLSILVSMVAFRQFTLTQTKADLQTTAPVAAPYLRLIQDKETENTPGEIAVTVFANTNGIKTMAADLDIEYDPQVLSYVTDSFQSTGAFAIHSENNIAPGEVSISLFSTPYRIEQPPVQTNADQEIPIARLKFRQEDKGAKIARVSFKYLGEGVIEDTNLVIVPENLEDPAQPVDILQSVQNVVVDFR